MKKAAVLFSVLLATAGGNYFAFAQTKQTKSTAKKASAATAKSDEQQGKELLAKSDCLSCHQEQVKIVGPAYVTVAEKYPVTEANVDLLSDKVIKGGAGSWGQVPMPPHPAMVKTDAKKMVRYILSIKRP